MSKLINLFIIIIFFSLSLTGTAIANVAMPGFWNVGTGREFIPVFKREENLFKHIRMNSELVTVYLYRNFAVVKGEYNMENTSDKAVTVHVGYPENGVYQNDVVKNIMFNNLTNVKVLVNNKPVVSEVKNLSGEITEDQKKYSAKGKSGWYVFPADFQPKSTTRIKVYYMVDTHDAILRRGYDTEKTHGFSYILESGQIWQDKILKGRIYIKLMEDLSEKDILGLLPEKVFKYEPQDKILIYDFSSLEPTNSSNIIIRYKGNQDNKFDISKLVASDYYSQIEKAESGKDFSATLTEINKTNFAVVPYLEYLVILILAIFMAIPIILIIVLIRIYLKAKRRRKK